MPVTPRPSRSPRRIGTVAAVLALTMALASPAFADDSYTVAPGDTLAAIAAEHGVGGWQRLYAANSSLSDPDVVVVGHTLRIPTGDVAGRDRRSAPRREAAASRGGSAGTNTVWDGLAECESGGDWSIDTGNGYYGGLQFSLDSWRAVGGNGYPHEASRSTQIAMAERLLAAQGWGAWPACSAQLGLG